MRRTVFASILLAGVVSMPLALAVVAVQWNGADPRMMSAYRGTAALWSARAYIAAFDVCVLTTWLPCALILLRLNMRIAARARAGGGVLFSD
jgi:hypothetical protein